MKRLPLDQAIKNLARSTFGMTREEAHKAEICIDCQRRPVLRTAEDSREYRTSALCPECFDKIGATRE